MTLSIELSPETVALLTPEAERRGYSLAELAQRYVAEAAAAKQAVRLAEHEARYEALRKWEEVIRGRDLPLLPDEAFERESFYDDSYRAGVGEYA